MRWIKAIIGWACIVALIWFCALNTQSTHVTVFNAELTAPVAVVVLLAAFLGAIGASRVKTIVSWVMPDKDR
jgi:uncharacterized integral membrane protein